MVMIAIVVIHVASSDNDNSTQCLWLVLRQPQVDLLLAGQDSKGPGEAEGCFRGDDTHGCWAGK